MPRKASSNSTKKKEETPKPQKEIKSDNHWTKLRSKEKDTSKRVLPDTILPGTRKRTNYNYNLNAMAKRNIDGDKVVKQRPSVSVNTLEQREKLKKLEERKRKKQEEQEQRRRRKKNTKKQEKEQEPDEESEQEEEEKQEAPKKKITSASSKKRARSPPPKKKQQEEEEEEEDDDKEESTEKDVNGQEEEEDEEPKPKKQATSKQQSKAQQQQKKEEKESKAKEEKASSNSNNKKQQQQKKKSETSDVEDFGEPLSKKVIDLAVKLNAKPSSTNVPRKYADKYNEPMAIRTFNNLKWPKVLYKSEKHDFGTMEIMEIDLAERNEYKFLQDPKTIIIGSGDVLLVAKLDDLSSDFNVWIVDDEAKDKVEGPFKISEILAELTVDDSVEDEEDEE